MATGAFDALEELEGPRSNCIGLIIIAREGIRGIYQD
jgi:hypothetical protein